MVKIPPSEAHKYVSPQVTHDVEKAKTKGQAFGKVVENLGKIALTKWHRITHFVGTLIKERKFDWVNDAEVLKQLTDRVKDLGNDIKSAEPKQGDAEKLKEINEAIPELVTKLKTSGVKDKLADLIDGLKKIGEDVKEDLRRLEAPPSKRGTREVEEKPEELKGEEKTQTKRVHKELIGTHRKTASSQKPEVEERPKDQEKLEPKNVVKSRKHEKEFGMDLAGRDKKKLRDEKGAETYKTYENRGDAKPYQIKEPFSKAEEKIGKTLEQLENDETLPREIEEEFDVDEEFDLDVEEGEEIEEEGEGIEEGEEVETAAPETKAVEKTPIDEKTAKQRMQAALREFVEIAEEHGLKQSLAQNLRRLGLDSFSKDNVKLNYFLNHKSYENLNKKQAIEFADKVFDLVEKGLEQIGVLTVDENTEKVIGDDDVKKAYYKALKAFHELKS